MNGGMAQRRRSIVAMKRLALIRYGLGQPPKLSENGIPIIRATNIYRGRIIAGHLIHAKLNDLPLARVPLLREGELLVVRSGAYTGDSARVTKEWAGAVPGYDLRITPRAIASRFLAYSLLTKMVADQIELSKNRAAQSHLNAEEFGDIRIPVPTNEEQRAVADFLDTETTRIDALITKKHRLIELLDEQDTATIDCELDDLLVQFGSFPFRRVIRHIEQGSSPQCDNVPAADDEWGVLKVSSVKIGHFWPEENKRLPDEVDPERRYEIRAGDLLITRANTPALVGAAATVRDVRAKLLLCDKIFRIEVTEDLNKDFLVYLSRGTRIRSLCAASSHGTSQSMANLKATEIKEWPIPAAPAAIQRKSAERISARLKRTASLRAVIGRQLELLVEHRQALITAAVTGELDIPAKQAG